MSTDLNTWTIGLLALSVPLFDGGGSPRCADRCGAGPSGDEAASQYRAKVRQAVSEVEQAPVRLQSTAERSASARTAAEGLAASSFDATEARWRGGLASLVELEDARRTALAAENALVALQHERQTAWIALYRAAGGGWKL
ncbi:MAG: TolC family protein [Paenacidovorax caeni]